MKVGLFSKKGFFYLIPSFNIVRYWVAHTFSSATLSPGQLGQYLTKQIDIVIGFLCFDFTFVIYKEK